MNKTYKITCIVASIVLVFNASAGVSGNKPQKSVVDICAKFNQMNFASKIDMSNSINMAMMKRCDEVNINSETESKSSVEAGGHNDSHAENNNETNNENTNIKNNTFDTNVNNNSHNDELNTPDGHGDGHH